MPEIEDAIKWINERLVYITTNCDLDDPENARAYKSLQTALNCMQNSKQ